MNHFSMFTVSFVHNFPQNIPLVPWKTSAIQHFLNEYSITALKIFFKTGEACSTCFDADTFLIFPDVFNRISFFQRQPGLLFLSQMVFSWLPETGRNCGCPNMTPGVQPIVLAPGRQGFKNGIRCKMSPKPLKRERQGLLRNHEMLGCLFPSRWGVVWFLVN